MTQKKPTKPFFKINFEDLEIAEVFFDNEKHYSEFLLAVSYYYRSLDYKIKNKMVQRYFETYKKTMDMVIEAKVTGQKGGLKSAETKAVKTDTLQGGVQESLQEGVPPNNKVLSINNKELNNNDEVPKKPKSVFTPPILSEVISYFIEKGFTEHSAIKAFNYYDVADWKDSKGTKVKSWKQKMQGVWFKDENKIETQRENNLYDILR